MHPGGARRNPLLALAAAAYGLGCAIALATLTIGPPHPGQLPGAMLLRGLDARIPMRMVLLAIAGPFVAALALTPLLRRFDGTALWARVAAAIALASGLWIAIVDPANVVAVILIPLILTAAVFLARTVEVSLTLAQWQRRTIVYVVYPLLCLALAYGLSNLRAEGTPRLDIFEDGHWLMPADAMLHGAVPYRDIVPGHGLINDGLLEYVVMRLGATDSGSVLAVRQWLTLLNAPLLYAVAFALTGSAEAALLSVLAAASMLITGTSYPAARSALDTIPSVRALAAMAALACCLIAVRRRDVRPLAAAGALAVLAVLTSIDYGVYSMVVLAVTILRFGPGRRRAVTYAAIGAAAVAAVAAIGMALAGCLASFLRVTVLEIPKLTEPYAMQFFWWPPQHTSLLGIPDVLAGLFLPRVAWIIIWALIVIGVAAAVATTHPPHPLADPMIVAGGWVIITALAFAERANVIFMPVALAMLVSAIFALREKRTAFVIAALTLAVACAPTQLVLRLLTHRPVDPALVRYEGLPRAHGAWIDGRNVRRLALLQSTVAKTLGPDDTFFDFANMPGLYYLLDRRCPVRMYEVPFFEADALQREVIAALERNPHVRLAVVQFTNRDDVWIDEVPNPVRAPLVFAWLREHFQPLLAGDGVQVWIRR